jgi:biofilm PGA synthesis N-glycosyltransferase PgaC
MEIHIWQFIFNYTHIVLIRLAELNCIIISIKKFFTIFFSQPFSIVSLITFMSFWGFNFTLWGMVGLFRLAQEKISQNPLFANFGKNRLSPSKVENNFKVNDVAAIVPAHNEEMVIAKTVTSLLLLVPSSNIFVISDGSTDKTAEIARNFRVNVLELNPSRGKAGALQAGIEHFSLSSKFKAVVFVDADTVLPWNYLEEALPYFSDKDVVAIAGYARTIWAPAKQKFRQIYFIAHREIVYTLSQLVLKFGQSWKFANVVTIVPGFASIYRASVLEKINLNPPGLVIEDFNMTF